MVVWLRHSPLPWWLAAWVVTGGESEGVGGWGGVGVCVCGGGI